MHHFHKKVSLSPTNSPLSTRKVVPEQVKYDPQTHIEPHTLRVTLPGESAAHLDLILNFLSPLKESSESCKSQATYLDEFKTYKRLLQSDPKTSTPEWLSKLNQQAATMISDPLAEAFIQLKAHSISAETSQSIYANAVSLLNKHYKTPSELSPHEQDHLKTLTLLVACAHIEGKNVFSDNQALDGILTEMAPTMLVHAREGVRAKVKDSHFGLLIALSYPMLTDQQRVSALTVVTSFFFDDDVTDNPASPVFSNSPLRKAVNDLLSSILNGTKEFGFVIQEITQEIGQSQTPYFLWLDPIASLFSEVQKVYSGLQEQASELLKSDTDNYFEYVTKMVEARSKANKFQRHPSQDRPEKPTGTLQSFQENVTARGYTGAVGIQITLALSLLDTPLPPAIFNDASFKNALHHASMASNYSNDILGFGRDPETDNLVSGLKTLGLDTLKSTLNTDTDIGLDEAALKVAAQLHNHHIQKALEALNELAAKCNSKLSKYKDSIDTICNVIYCACNSISIWQENSGRYPGFSPSTL